MRSLPGRSAPAARRHHPRRRYPAGRSGRPGREARHPLFRFFVASMGPTARWRWAPCTDGAAPPPRWSAAAGSCPSSQRRPARGLRACSAPRSLRPGGHEFRAVAFVSGPQMVAEFTGIGRDRSAGGRRRPCHRQRLCAVHRRCGRRRRRAPEVPALEHRRGPSDGAVGDSVLRPTPEPATSSPTAKRRPTTPGTCCDPFVTMANSGSCGRGGPDRW